MRTQWFGIYTNSNHEMYAARELSAQGLEVFAPRILVGATLRPLFSRYIFAKWSDETGWKLARGTRGVAYIVGYPMEPIPIDPVIMFALRSECDEQGVLLVAPKIITPQNYAKDDFVRVVDGPFTSFCGRVRSARNDRQRVEILLSIFGRENKVELDAAQIELV